MGHVVKGHGHVVPAVVMDARARAAAILDDARARASATASWTVRIMGTPTMACGVVSGAAKPIRKRTFVRQLL